MSITAPRLQNMANAIRVLSMDAVQAANSGHPGMPMGMADVATVLFSKFLKFDPAQPRWPDRDRFILSAGHGSMLIYSLLHLTGYEQPTIEDIKNFRQLHSVCAGHPENFELPGVECTTGPLGQGLAMSVGFAIAERHLNAQFGDDLVDHKTFVIAGDGCIMEGINHEAIGLAGHLKLGRLVVLWDDNRITIDGDTDLSTSEDVAARYTATGWHVVSCDGHDFADIERAIAEAVADPRPSLVACRTIIGKGAPNKQGGHSVHGSPLGAAEVEAARGELGWTLPAFELPADVLGDWRNVGALGKTAAVDWAARVAASDKGAELLRRMNGELPDQTEVQATFDAWLEGNQKVATRKASQLALEVLTAHVPEMVGGSADLTGSNLTDTKSTRPFGPQDYSGRYVYYGIREFGMAAAMNGMALHGGIIPYGGTFLVFSDYCRNAIRMSAIQRAKVVYVLTHDSIGLGEDGPTHQPIEHVMSMRMIPNLEVFRPADVIETAEAWQLAIANEGRPSVLALTRQNLPQLRHSGPNLTAKGGYRLVAATAQRKVVIVATGSEVEIAMATRAALEAQGVGADVVSMPSMSRFLEQDAAYKADVLPADVLKVSIEAGTTFGWERITGLDGLRFGIDTFGASAPAPALYDYFGLTAEKIAPQILAALQN
ncbi:MULTISPECIES: transketolase [unclassified Novosphingobium]|uniref:transketolase n=1 Tax=unclassified Novosphingobium TaxID=2644732 RepID=UPI00086E06B0|nr:MULTISPECIES: transketolase [unclassified Novosphingobium]MBN9143581.1 transketolase [Novosphingobium sp.]MDR6706831.1 transketolase [Novosphingobium sp. 1748]ODU83665.1 MAG: transketolase [Novosphingobium sp. SCN 63-17]OJX92753.1 MAG: transketolase [Novosphingobium sp. 63-713]